MKSHITEEQCIQWLFDLADPGEAKAIADHVGLCEACSALKTRVQTQFSQLDVLQGDPILSEALIQETQASCQSRPVKPVNWWWLSLAACLVFASLGSVVVMTRPGGIFEQGGEMVRSMAPEVLDRSPRMDKTETLAMAMPVATMGSDPGPLSDPFAETPFAPASAIELVTLPRREHVQVTIYNEEDLTLVREQRRLTLKRGWNWLQFMWANTMIDPTSLDLQPKLNQDTVTVEQLVYPAGLKDIGRWLIRSEVDGQVPFELTYFTSGLFWRATYMGTLSQDETSMDLASYVRVGNQSGEDFTDTQVRLVLGDIRMLEPILSLAHRPHAFGRPRQNTDRSDGLESAFKGREESPVVMDDTIASPSGRAIFGTGSPKDVVKKTLSEYVLYTIEGKENLKDQWGKRLLSFEVNDVPVESLYKYDESRWGKQAIRFVSFANDADHKLGGTPMPQGNIKLFGQANTDGLAFVGNSEFKYIPVNEDVTLNMGPARYVKVEPILMDVKTTAHAFDPNGNLIGWNTSKQWEIEVTNTRPVPVKIEITRALKTNKWSMDQHGEAMVYEEYDVHNAKFTLTLAPKEQRQETYTVTTYHGTNQKPITDN